jgi:hypothetical protein
LIIPTRSNLRDGSLKLWVDHPDPEQREIRGSRFLLVTCDPDGDPHDGPALLETDSWAEMKAAIAEAVEQDR